MTTYIEATTARTAATIRTANLALAASLGVNIAGFDDTAPQRAIFETDARALEAEEAIRVKLAQAGFLTKAALAGEDFFDEALTWFDLVRIPANKAVWTLKLTCEATAGPYSLTTATGEYVAQADDGTYFESTPIANATLAAGSTLLVRFTSTATGTSGNQTPGNITHLVVGRPGVTVTNASPATLDTSARNRETTAAATLRALGRWGTLGAGWTRASFDYLVPTLASAVTRWKLDDANPYGPGSVALLAANAAGTLTVDDTALLVAGLGSASVKPLGSGLFVVAAPSILTVVVTGTLYGDGTNVTLLTDAKRALAFIAEACDIGGVGDTLTLDLAVVLGALMGGAYPAFDVPGFLGATGLTLAAPAADIAFAANEVLIFDTTGLVLG
jgi:hypothetical protein